MTVLLQDHPQLAEANFRLRVDRWRVIAKEAREALQTVRSGDTSPHCVDAAVNLARDCHAQVRLAVAAYKQVERAQHAFAAYATGRPGEHALVSSCAPLFGELTLEVRGLRSLVAEVMISPMTHQIRLELVAIEDGLRTIRELSATNESQLAQCHLNEIRRRSRDVERLENTRADLGFASGRDQQLAERAV